MVQEGKDTVYAIQTFVEKIVEDLVDNVDDTSIDELYRNSDCRYYDVISTIDPRR